jgi:hypothetical protein
MAERCYVIYPLPEQLLPVEIRIYSCRIKPYSNHYEYDVYNHRFII